MDANDKPPLRALKKQLQDLEYMQQTKSLSADKQREIGKQIGILAKQIGTLERQIEQMPKNKAQGENRKKEISAQTSGTAGKKTRECLFLDFHNRDYVLENDRDRNFKITLEEQYAKLPFILPYEAFIDEYVNRLKASVRFSFPNFDRKPSKNNTPSYRLYFLTRHSSTSM